MLDAPSAGTAEAHPRSVRARKLTDKVRVFSPAERRTAHNARLEALENDDAAAGAGAPDSDDEYAPAPGEEGQEPALGGGLRKKKGKGARGGVKRKTRAALEAERAGPQTFAVLLKEANLEELPAYEPSYLTAAVGPPTGCAARKWCSVCGYPAPYTCVRCGARFCTRKCNAVHVETRCLKFVG